MDKKIVFIILAVLLFIVMIVAFSTCDGCSNSNNRNKRNNRKTTPNIEQVFEVTRIISGNLIAVNNNYIIELIAIEDNNNSKLYLENNLLHQNVTLVYDSSIPRNKRKGKSVSNPQPAYVSVMGVCINTTIITIGITSVRPQPQQPLFDSLDNYQQIVGSDNDKDNDIVDKNNGNNNGNNNGKYNNDNNIERDRDSNGGYNDVSDVYNDGENGFLKILLIVFIILLILVLIFGTDILEIVDIKIAHTFGIVSPPPFGLTLTIAQIFGVVLFFLVIIIQDEELLTYIVGTVLIFFALTIFIQAVVSKRLRGIPLSISRWFLVTIAIYSGLVFVIIEIVKAIFSKDEEKKNKY